MSGRGREVSEEKSSVSSANGTMSTRKNSSLTEKDQNAKEAGVDVPQQRTLTKGTGSAQTIKTQQDTCPSSHDGITPAKEDACRTTGGSATKEEVPQNTTKRPDHTDHNPYRILQDTLQKLKIKKQERASSTKCVKEISDRIIDHLKKSLYWCKELGVLKTGSYYENVKICGPDEFDVMLTISVERVEIQPFTEDGAFYSVAMKRLPQKHTLDKFLSEDKTIKASEMLQEFRGKVKEIVPKLPYDITMERKKKGCPAVTLVVKHNEREISLDLVLALEVRKSSWPRFTVDGLRIDKWLGKKVKQDLKREPFYLVPKYEGRGNAEHDGVFAKDTWRISFSHIEKKILKNHGASKTCCEEMGTKCCRKQCLKLTKYLILRLREEHPKEMSKFHSYLAKTTLLHACSTRVTDSEWATGKLSCCFQQLLEDFENHLKSQHLPNFFIPSHNLLNSAGLDKKSCEFLANCIEYQRNNGFPVFC